MSSPDFFWDPIRVQTGSVLACTNSTSVCIPFMVGKLGRFCYLVARAGLIGGAMHNVASFSGHNFSNWKQPETGAYE